MSTSTDALLDSLRSELQTRGSGSALFAAMMEGLATEPEPATLRELLHRVLSRRLATPRTPEPFLRTVFAGVPHPADAAIEGNGTIAGYCAVRLRSEAHPPAGSQQGEHPEEAKRDPAVRRRGELLGSRRCAAMGEVRRPAQ